MGQYFDDDLSVKDELRLIKIMFGGKVYEMYTNNGLFSKDRLDYGTYLLLTLVTERRVYGRVLDLGCGYGVVGIIISSIYSDVSVDMVDITDRAVFVSKKNVDRLGFTNINVFKSDIYERVNGKYNYIITNPPIRAGKDVLRRFLKGAVEYLDVDGELWFVMRKDHGVKSIIRELEDVYEIEIMEKSKGFYIVKCKVK